MPKKINCYVALSRTSKIQQNNRVIDSNDFRRIYIANFAIFKIAIILILPCRLARKIAKFQLHETSRFNLVGKKAHVRSQATVHAFMHAEHAVCWAEFSPYRYTFKRARVASKTPEVLSRSRDEKSRHFCGYHLHWLTSLETSEGISEKSHSDLVFFWPNVSRVFM